MYVPINHYQKAVVSSNNKISLSDQDITISRTDTRGNILFCNHTLCEISGYGQKELLHTPHSILRHSDMPKAIFYLIWQKLLAGLSTQAVIKNFTKSGDYYWTLIKFSVLRDNHYNIVSYIAEGSKPTEHLIKKIEPLYESIRDHERRYGMYSSIRYFSTILEQENVGSYPEYIHKINENKKPAFYFSLKL